MGEQAEQKVEEAAQPVWADFRIMMARVTGKRENANMVTGFALGKIAVIKGAQRGFQTQAWGSLQGIVPEERVGCKRHTNTYLRII